MIEISYRLHGEDGNISHEERTSDHVPRVGDMLAFDFNGPSYQVIDVLWHLRADDPVSVTITAGELNWHKYIGDATAAWHDRISQPDDEGDPR